MSFEIDDSNPENPLDLYSPSDYGMETWTDLLIHYHNLLCPESTDSMPLFKVREIIRQSIHVILAYLVEQSLKQNPKGGDK